jgi:hypothetical protein
MQVNMRRFRSPMIAAGIAAAVLAALGATYWYTVEPAPAVKVRWREGLDPGQRTALERRLLLVSPIVTEGRTITYNLLDTRAANLQALVTADGVEDTSEIDRQRYTLPADVPYGTRWTWLAYRLPLVRTPGAIETLVGACLLVMAWAAVTAARRARPGAVAG